ncbi:hypothetical protein [Streptomyces sp. enrichment culture]|uniref:hypothetical protein n=1 Tax=Streptomyces sp. enrichment culture TaxID=1795815 RepID=UPI003F556C85
MTGLAAEYTLTKAFPFALGILLQLLGILIGVVIERRIRSTVACLLNRDHINPDSLPTYLTPAGVSRYAVWATEVIQAATVVIGPGFAFVLDSTGHLEGSSTYPYLWITMAACFIFWIVLAFKNPSRYLGKGIGPLAPVTIIGLLLNGVFLLIVWL